MPFKSRFSVGCYSAETEPPQWASFSLAQIHQMCHYWPAQYGQASEDPFSAFLVEMYEG